MLHLNFLDNMKLKNKLLIVGALGLTILSLITIIIAINNSKIQNNLAVEKFESSTIQSLDKAISAQFYERYGDIQAFAVNSVLQEKNIQNITEVFNSYSSTYGIYDIILFVDTKGNYIASNNKNASGSAINSSKLASKNYSQEEWFINALSEKYTENKTNGFAGTYFEDAKIDPLIEVAYGKKILSTSFSTVVKNKSGEKIGVITNRANASWFNDEIQYIYENASKEKELEIMLLNKKGEIIVDYSPSRNSNKLEIDPFFKARQSNQFFNSTPFKEIMSNKTDSMIYFDNDLKSEINISYKQISNKKFIPEIEWRIVATIPTNILFGVNKRNAYLLIITVCFIFILSLISVILFSNFISKLFLNSVKELNHESGVMNQIGDSLKKSSQFLNKAVEEQAASLHESTAAINEITSMVNRTTENANESTKIAKDSSVKAEQGQKIMNDLVSSMEAIQESSAQLQDFSNMIAQIHSKTAVINDIVAKTELLSLNASIESARAGEHGKGFAVVAEEVGNLAKISGKSAQEIQELIASSQEQVNKILNITKERINEGKKVTSTAQETFQTINNNIQSLSMVMEQIFNATKEQEIGVRQISITMGQIDKITQKCQESANTSLEISNNVTKQSQNIESSSYRIEILIKGKVS
jgi:methyl-accepting chemotaxis protein